MLAWFNSAATPEFIVWRKQVSREEFEEDDAFNWTVVDNLSTGSKYRIWEWMFGSKGYINPSKANICLLYTSSLQCRSSNSGRSRTP